MKPDVALTSPSCGDRERALDHVADLRGVRLASTGRLHTAGRQRPGNATEAADAAVLYLPDDRQHIGCECIGGRRRGRNSLSASLGKARVTQALAASLGGL